jgi:hypothetical protein
MTKDLIADAIIEAFGERCPDYGQGCLCCEAWKQYDEIARLRERLEVTDGAILVAVEVARGFALEEAANVADEWEPLERLLPFGNDDQNECAHTGQHEAAERIAAAIRALKGGE